MFFTIEFQLKNPMPDNIIVDFFLWVNPTVSADYEMNFYWRYWKEPDIPLLEYDHLVSFPEKRNNFSIISRWGFRQFTRGFPVSPHFPTLTFKIGHCATLDKVTRYTLAFTCQNLKLKNAKRRNVRYMLC